MPDRGRGVAQIELPVACTLGVGDGVARMRRWQALAKGAPPRARRTDNRLDVRWHLDADGAIELDLLAAAERECCPFLSWTVTRAGTDSVLTVVADPSRPDDVATIAALFAAG
jgi:hypothetical protein